MMPALASPTMAPSSPASRPSPTGGLRPALTPAPGGADGQLSGAWRAEGQDQQSKIRSTDVSTVWGYSRRGRSGRAARPGKRQVVAAYAPPHNADFTTIRHPNSHGLSGTRGSLSAVETAGEGRPPARSAPTGQAGPLQGNPVPQSGPCASVKGTLTVRPAADGPGPRPVSGLARKFVGVRRRGVALGVGADRWPVGVESVQESARSGGELPLERFGWPVVACFECGEVPGWAARPGSDRSSPRMPHHTMPISPLFSSPKQSRTVRAQGDRSPPLRRPARGVHPLDPHPTGQAGPLQGNPVPQSRATRPVKGTLTVRPAADGPCTCSLVVSPVSWSGFRRRGVVLGRCSSPASEVSSRSRKSARSVVVNFHLNGLAAWL